MNVAFVNQDPGIAPGREKGAAVHLSALRSALARQGAQVFAFDEPDERALRERLAACAHSVQLDLVYERYALGCTTALRFALARDIPYALELDAPLLEEARLFRGHAPNGAEVAAETFLFRRATCVFAVSEPLAECARAGGARRVEVCPNGVDAALFRPRTDDALRAELVPAGRMAVGFHGRLRPWHGLELLAEAFALALGDGAPLHLVTAGVGDFAAALGDRVPRERWTHVEWLPHERIAAVVACFDALALSYRDGGPLYFSPLKLAEGMACGVVPVVPEGGDWCRLVEHGVDALVYPLGRPRGLADALCELAGDPALRARLACAAQSKARSFSWDAIAARVLSIAAADRSSL